MKSNVMCEYLENVLAGKSNRTFESLSGEKVRIPLLIGRKTAKNTSFYSTNIQKLSSSQTLATNPNRVQTKNLAQGAMLYAVYSELGDDHPDLQELNNRLNTYQRGGGEHARLSPEAAKAVNSVWSNLFNDPITQQKITDTAGMLLKEAIKEMSSNGDLDACKVSQTQCIKASELFVKSFTHNLIHRKEIALHHDHDISEIYSNTPEKIKEFLNDRFSSSDPEYYLRMLLTTAYSDKIQEACKSINIDFSAIAKDVPFRQEGEKSSSSNSLSSKALRNARMNKKKGVQGNISAYIKPDQKYGQYGVSHLVLNVVEFDGGDTLSTSDVLYSHMEVANDPTSTNELTTFLKKGTNVSPFLDATATEKFAAQEQESIKRRQQLETEIIEENKVKRASAFTDYKQLESVTSADQLLNGYFGQKGLSELAFEYLQGLKVSSDGDVWIPLGNVIQTNPTADNIEGFQALLAKKSDYSGVNKNFEGIGEGLKHKCSVTIGDPEKASVILAGEGIANGLLHMEMAEQNNINVAVVCALDVGNITSAIEKIITEHPTKPIINIADHDKFNSEQEPRFLKHELKTRGIEPTSKNVNVGLDKAVEIQQAVNVPYLYFDFENDIPDQNLLPYQQANKGSDVDDLFNALTTSLDAQGVSTPSETAWEQVTQCFVKKVTDVMQHAVSPHWSVDTQHEFGWCPSYEKLNAQGFPDYYHMKDPIIKAHDFFREKMGMAYETYFAMARTVHWGSQPEIADIVTNEQYEQELEQHIERTNSQEVMVNNDSHTSTPMTEVDTGPASLLSPEIQEDATKIDEKIAALTRRLTNLTKKQSEFPAVDYYKRVEERTQSLEKLIDEKARLLGVSAQHVIESSHLEQYFTSEYDEPLPVNESIQPTELINELDLEAELMMEELDSESNKVGSTQPAPSTQEASPSQFENLENAETAIDSSQSAADLVNNVFKTDVSTEPTQTEGKGPSEENRTQWVQEITDSLDQIIAGSLSGQQYDEDTVLSLVMELEEHLSQLNPIHGVSRNEIRQSDKYAKYYQLLDQYREPVQAKDKDKEIEFNQAMREAFDQARLQSGVSPEPSPQEEPEPDMVDSADAVATEPPAFNDSILSEQGSPDELQLNSNSQSELDEVVQVENSPSGVPSSEGVPEYEAGQSPEQTVENEHQQELGAQPEIDPTLDVPPSSDIEQSDAIELTASTELKPETDVPALSPQSPSNEIVRESEQTLGAPKASAIEEAVSIELNASEELRPETDLEVNSDKNTLPELDSIIESEAAQDNSPENDSSVSLPQNTLIENGPEIEPLSHFEDEGQSEIQPIVEGEPILDMPPAPMPDESIPIEHSGMESTQTEVDSYSPVEPRVNHSVESQDEPSDIQELRKSLSAIEKWKEELTSVKKNPTHEAPLYSKETMQQANVETLTAFFEKVLDKVTKQHSTTLKTVATLTDKVLEQQAKLTDVIANISSELADVKIELAKQRGLSPNLDSTSLGAEIEAAPELEQKQEPKVEELQQLDAVLKEKKNLRAVLVNEVEKKMETAPSPESAAKLFNNESASKKALSKAPTKHEALEHVRAHAEAINSLPYSQLPQETRTLIHDALAFYEPINLNTFKQDMNKAKATIKEFTNDVFGNQKTRRGLGVSLALSACLRGENPQSHPASAIRTFVFSEYVGEKEALYQPAVALLEGHSSADEYYQQCQAILGNEKFLTTLGGEYDEFTAYQKSTNRIPEARPEPEDSPAPPLGSLNYA